MRRKDKSINKSFTIIELLVVIGIIGVLASLVLVSVGKARGSARDARRKQDLGAIQTALELYYDDHGKYPNWWSTDCCGDTSRGACNSCPCSEHHWSYNQYQAFIKDALVGGGYITNLPVDPLNDTSHYYLYTSQWSSECYSLCVDLESGEQYRICGGTYDDNCAYAWSCCGCP